MKKLIFIVIVFLISISVNAQKIRIIEPGILHKDGEPIGSSKPQKRFDIGVLGTTRGDSIYRIRIDTSVNNFKIGSGTIAPSYSVQFRRDSLNFHIDFRVDYLKVGGNMPMSKSAELFIEWCRKYMKTKIDSLESENKRLRKLYGL